MQNKTLRSLTALTGPSDGAPSGAEGVDPTAGNLGLIGGAAPIGGLKSGAVTMQFPVAAGKRLNVVIEDSEPMTLTLAAMRDLEEARKAVEDAIRGQATKVSSRVTNAFGNARVVAYEDDGAQRLIVLSGQPSKAVVFSKADTDTTCRDLGLETEQTVPVSGLMSRHIAFSPGVSMGKAIEIKIGGAGPVRAELAAEASDLLAIAGGLQSAIHAASTDTSFTGAIVAAYAGFENRLVIIPGSFGDTVLVNAASLDGAERN